MSSEQIEALTSEVKLLTKIIAIDILKDKKQTDRISLLLEFGLDNKTIANLLGIKDNIVRSTKSKKKAKDAKTGQSSAEKLPGEE